MKFSGKSSAGNCSQSGESRRASSPSIIGAGSSAVKTPDSFEEETAYVDPSELRAAQVEQLYYQASSGVYGAFILACVLVLTFWTVASHTLLIAWFACICTIYALRQVLIVKFLKSKISGIEALGWERPFSVLTAISGLLWGIASVLFFPSSSPVHLALLAMILTGLCNGVLIIYCTLKSVYLPFILLGGLPLVGRLVYEQDPFLLAAGFMIAVYITVLVVTGGRMNRAFTRYLRMRFLKNDLIDFLGQEKRRVEHLYDALKEKTAEEQKAAVALRKSEEKYRELVEKANDVIFNADSSGHLTYVNPTVPRITGWAENELIGMHYLEFISPQSRKMVERHYGIQFVKKTLDTYLEFPIVTKEDKTLWLGQFVHLSVQGDTITGFQAMGRDITDRKQAEKALKESEERLELALKGGDLGLWDYDLRTGEAFVSERRLEMVGYSRGELRPHIGSWVQLVHPDDRDRAVNEFKAHVQGMTPLYESEHRLRHRSGEYIWTLARGKVVEWDEHGKPVRVVGTSLDMTDRKRAEEALISAHNELEQRVEQRTSELRDTNKQLREQIAERRKVEEALRDSEQRLRAVVYGCPIPQFVIDRDKQVIFWNKALEEISGISAEEMVGTKQHWKAFYTEERPCIAELLVDGDLEGIADWHGGKCTKSRLSTEAYEATEFFPAMGGGGKWLYFTVAAIRDSKGNVMGAVETLEDITDRKQAEQALRESEERYRALFEESRDAVYISSRDGRLLAANQAFLDLFGFTREEAKDMDLLKINVDAVDRERFQRDIERNVSLKDYEIRYRKKDGTIVDCLDSSSLRLDKDGTILGYHGIIRDVTRQKQLQSQLLQAQKMEAIGTLAGGVAHDFNNLLQAVLGYAGLLLMEKSAGDADYEELQGIRQAARDGADLVARILTFSRKGESKKRPVELNEEIRKAEKLLRRTLPKMIRIDLKLCENIKIIDADPAQLEQVMLNLGINAQHAMPNGGRLLLETSNVSLSDECLRAHLGAEEGEYVLLTISDTGVGMDPDVVERIFEPFFTTKPDGLGTGLGLSMVHGIVTRLGGYITCYSELSRGTSFKIYLPVSHTEVAFDPGLTAEMPAFGTETILLVDDDDRIRKMGRQMIQMGGYKVLVAKSGEEALEIYSSHGKEVDLVVLDLIMPGIGGSRCLDALLRMDPHVKVLIASGYSNNYLNHEEQDTGARGFVSKPYEMKVILAAIRKVLDEGHL